MNLEELQKIINENNQELEILNSLVSEETDEEAKDVKESTDVDEIFAEIKKLNPGVYLELDDAGKANRGIASSVPGNRLNLPEGFEYNDKNGITNKHDTESGAYASISVRPLEKAKRDRIQEYNGISREALKDRKAFLDDQNGKLNAFKTNAEKKVSEIRELNDKIKNEKDAKKRKEFSKELKQRKDELNIEKQNVVNNSQGKTKEVISNYFGQIDKRIHNLLYRDNKVGNTLWKWHCGLTNWRYNHVILYPIAGIVATAGVFIAASAIMPAAYPAIYALTGVVGTNFIAKTVASAFNIIKYHDMPKLVQHKNIRKGSFLENINNALLERRKTKNANRNIRINKKLLRKGDNGKNLPAVTNSDEERIFNDYRNKLNNCDVDSLTIDSLTDDKARELNEIVSALSSNKEKLTPEEAEKLNKLSSLLTNYFNKENTENNEENKKISKYSPVVQKFVDGVEGLDLNNLDPEEVSNLYNQYNKMTDSQKNEIRDAALMAKLGKAIKKLRDNGTSLNSSNNNTEVSELNELIKRVDLEKIQSFLGKGSLKNLNDEKKQALYRIHDELVDVRRIMDIISSGKINEALLSGENSLKLHDIINLFGKNNSKVNNVLPNKVEVVLYEIVDRTGRTFAGYSAVCNFFKDEDKFYERTMFVENDNRKVIENKLQQLYGFTGEIYIRKAKKDDYTEDYNDLNSGFSR